MPSTVIASYTYNATEAILTIIFTTGKVYEYLGVPPEVIAAMKSSFAKGIFFNQEIKGNYKCRKIET